MHILPELRRTRRRATPRDGSQISRAIALQVKTKKPLGVKECVHTLFVLVVALFCILGKQFLELEQLAEFLKVIQ